MTLDNSRDYYGKVLSGSEDLRTDACCTTDAPARHILDALANVHEEVKARYYGCGLVVPQAVEGAHVLDLGSGSGQDAYLLAQMVGPNGSVTGVDATDEQLAVANEHLAWHEERFGFANVRFLKGDIEKLDELDLEPASFDVIVSNCVINLVADKAKVFAAAYRLLKPGGELYFSDVYADRRVPAHLLGDPVLHGECLSGALYWGDFDALSKSAGFADPRLVTDRPLEINDAKVSQMLNGISFVSATYRLFKIDGLESQCEDYGQGVVYKGTLRESPRLFELDAHHAIEAGRMFPVCGNSWKMLADTRFAEHFEFFGDFSQHFGVFPGCGTAIPFGQSQSDLNRADSMASGSATSSGASCC